MKYVLYVLAIICLAFPVKAAVVKGPGLTVAAVIDATTDIVQVLQVQRRGGDNGMYKATVFANGTFNGCTIHWLVSPDGGTTKIADRDLTHIAVTSTANDVITFEYGLPNSFEFDDGIILYASVDGVGCSGTPDIDVSVFDYR